MVVSAEGFFVLAGFRLAGIALARFRLAGFGLAGLALAGFALPDSDWSGLRWSDSHWKYRQCAPERHRRTWYAASPGRGGLRGVRLRDQAWTDSFPGVISMHLSPSVALVPELSLIPASASILLSVLTTPSISLSVLTMKTR